MSTSLIQSTDIQEQEHLQQQIPVPAAATSYVPDYAKITALRDAIDRLPKKNHIDILRILKRHNRITLNENNYGIFVNLPECPPEVLTEIEIYVDYINSQEITLEKAEKEKEDYKQKFFRDEENELATSSATSQQTPLSTTAIS